MNNLECFELTISLYMCSRLLKENVTIWEKVYRLKSNSCSNTERWVSMVLEVIKLQYVCVVSKVLFPLVCIESVSQKTEVKYYLKHEHELRVFWIASKTIHFIPILSLCLRKNFEYRCCISRENRGKSFVKIYVCFITYKDSFTAMIFFVFCSWIINEFLKSVLRKLEM